MGWWKGEPGLPRLTSRTTLVMPPVVVKLREAVPPTRQTATNSSREAQRKLYLCWSILRRSGGSKDHVVGLDQAVILESKGDINRVGEGCRAP